MKIQRYNRNHAFTRPQWLVVILLSLLGFELGTRYAARNDGATARPAQKVAATNIWRGAEKLLDESSPTNETVETAEIEMTNSTQIVRRTTNQVNSSGSAGAGSAGPEFMKGDGPITKRKAPWPTNNYVRGTNVVTPPLGIRIALP